MRLLTTQEFSEILECAYARKTECLGETLYQVCNYFENDTMSTLKQLIDHAKDCGTDFYHWENDIAVIKYFIDNFVEEF